MAAIRSPNIWDTPNTYELENLASDRAGVIDAFIGSLHPWAGARVLDVGCGTGFHLPRFAGYAACALGLEPHLPLVTAARDRLRRTGIGPTQPAHPADPAHSADPAAGPVGRAAVVAGPVGRAAVVAGSAGRAAVVAGSAEAIPLPDASVDIVHARWAYFFGAGSEPGLAEVQRVLRPGGIAAFVDNDVTRSTFGGWFSAAYPAYDPAGVQRYWDRHGFATQPLTIAWTFERRADLEAVVRIELPPAAADAALAAHDGLEVDYAVLVRWRRA